jgi:hypothetical protein
VYTVGDSQSLRFEIASHSGKTDGYIDNSMDLITYDSSDDEPLKIQPSGLKRHNNVQPRNVPVKR